MILAFFGTIPYPFLRLKNALTEFLSEHPQESLIAQLGNTSREIYRAECSQFISRERILELMGKAKVVVTQGGFGSGLSLAPSTLRIPELS